MLLKSRPTHFRGTIYIMQKRNTFLSLIEMYQLTLGPPSVVWSAALGSEWGCRPCHRFSPGSRSSPSISLTMRRWLEPAGNKNVAVRQCYDQTNVCMTTAIPPPHTLMKLCSLLSTGRKTRLSHPHDLELDCGFIRICHVDFKDNVSCIHKWELNI